VPGQLVVTRAWETNLEAGVIYEVSYADRTGKHGPIVAGFVFEAPPSALRRMEGQVDFESLRDFRDVDGSRLARDRRSMKHGDAQPIADKIAALNAAVESYRKAGGEVERRNTHDRPA
jgi:hypothetical protein